MSVFEKQAWNWTQKHLVLICAFLVTLLLGLLYLNFGLHFDLMSVPSTDFKGSIDPWWHIIRQEGVANALHAPVGDYPMSYQAILTWMTTLPLNVQGATKLIWGIADFIMAALIGVISVNISTDNIKWGGSTSH